VRGGIKMTRGSVNRMKNAPGVGLVREAGRSPTDGQCHTRAAVFSEPFWLVVSRNRVSLVIDLMMRDQTLARPPDITDHQMSMHESAETPDACRLIPA